MVERRTWARSSSGGPKPRGMFPERKLGTEMNCGYPLRGVQGDFFVADATGIREAHILTGQAITEVVEQKIIDKSE